MAIEKIDLLSNKREAKKATGGDYVFVVEAVDAKGATIKNVDNDTVAIQGNAADYIVKATGAGVIVTKNLDGLTGAELKAAKQFKLTITLQKENAKKGVDAGVVKLAFADGSVDLTRDGKNIVVDGTDIVISKKAKDAAALEIVNADETFDNQVPADDNGGEPQQPSQTFTLTTGTDNFAGTDKSEAINGSINTLTANDRLIDSSTADSDVLNVELLGGATVPSSVEIKNVENLNFNVLSGTATVDAGNFAGYKSIASVGTGTLTLSNLSDKSAELVVKGNASLNVTHATAAVAGANDNVNVTLDSATGGTVTVGANVETVTLTTKGAAAVLDNFTSAATTVVIKGGQGFTLGTPATGFATATTIDAREAGKAAFTSSAAGSVAILTGAADDTITRAVNFAAADLFNLGAGNDTLVMSTATTSGNKASFVGVENVVFKTAASGIDMSNADKAAALTFEGGAAIDAKGLAAGSTIASTKLAASTVDVAFRDAVKGEATTLNLAKGASGLVTVTNIKNLTVDFAEASLGSIALDATANGTEVTTDLTINAKGAISTGAITNAGELKNLTINAQAAVTTAALTAGKLETLAVNNTSNAALVTLGAVTATNTAGITSVKLDAAGGAITTGVIQNSGAIKDVTVSGSKNVTTLLTSTTANVDKVVSTATGDNSITITNAGTANAAGSTVTLGDAALGKANTLIITGTAVNNTVTGGSGVDKITISSTGNDTVNAGAGNDEISVAGGANTLTGGAGADKFIFTGGVGAVDAAALAAKHTVITDFSGLAGNKDVIDFGANVAVGTTAVAAGVTVSAAGLITNWGTNASSTLAEKITAAAAATAGAANEAVAFAHEGKSYLFVNDATAAVGAGDTLIQLTGVTLSAGFTLATGDITNFA